MTISFEENMIRAWIEKEFDTRKSSKKDEIIFCCPWCDTKKKHYDYSFNVKKGVGKCWRGFNETCESGHTLLLFVSFYYNIPFNEAKSLIRSKFESENSLQRVKKKLKDIGIKKNLSLTEERIIWQLPNRAENVVTSNDKNARKALAWLKRVRLIPTEVIHYISPVYIGDRVDRRWKRHVGRIFFPVASNGNSAWLSYSMKKSKKIPKTLNPPGAILSNMLYLYDLYTSSQEPVILCEGIFDALRLFIFGFNAVALFGTNISDVQIELLNMLPTNEVVVCLDADATRPTFSEKKNKWSSKAFKLSQKLKAYYLGDVSMMKIHLLEKNPSTKLDPDLLTFQQAKRIFSEREYINSLSASLRRLKAKYA